MRTDQQNLLNPSTEIKQTEKNEQSLWGLWAATKGLAFVYQSLRRKGGKCEAKKVAKEIIADNSPNLTKDIQEDEENLNWINPNKSTP